MKFAQRIKQRFCRHEDDPNTRNCQMPFIGYEFQCPKCGAYVAYFARSNSYFVVAELQHNILVEEGEKFLFADWMFREKRDKNDDE